MTAEQHLKRAKEYLRIAESGDSKKAAYKAVAEEVAAAVEGGMSRVQVATGIGKTRQLVQQLLRWRESGYKADTPWLADEGATTRAAKSHTKAFLKNAPMEQIEQIIADLPDSRKRQIGAAAGDAHLSRVNELAERVRDSGHDFDRTTDLGFWPNLYTEKRQLLAKLVEIKEWLDQHGSEDVPDPDGGPTEKAAAIMLDVLAADKGEIDHAFSEVGVGTSIEAGFNSLLSDS